MRRALERLPYGVLVPVGVAATIFAFACGSSSVQVVNAAGKPARWAMLLALLGLAAAWARLRGSRAALATAPVAIALLFLAFAGVSSIWSVDPWLSLERAGSVAILFATAALLAAGREPATVLAGVLFGAVAVALAGLVVLAVAHGTAVVPANASTPARFRGFGENPDTAPLLFALGVPIALAASLAARTVPARAAAAALFALLAGSIVASGSRGALLGAGVGAFVSALLFHVSAPRRAIAAAAVAAALAAGAYLESIPKPLSAHPRPAEAAAPRPNPKLRYLNVENALPLDSEMGGPPPGIRGPTAKRSFFGSSGRDEAWAGAIRQAAQRPLLGFGFGTEDRVFVDRYYSFAGGRPENSYIGIGLQFGALGVATLIALLVTIALAGRKAPWGTSRPTAAVAFGVLAAGMTTAMVQSYLYSAGNIAAGALWFAAFLLPAAALPDRGMIASRRPLFRAVGVAALLAALVPVGLWERSRWIDAQVRGMARVEAAVGPLDDSALSGYRVLPALDCLVYRRGADRFALELCFDPSGRLIETIDRTRTTSISSLRAEPAASSIRVDRPEVDRLLRKMGAIG